MKEKFQVMSKMMESLPDTLLLLNSSGCVEGYHSGNIDIFMGEDPVNTSHRGTGAPLAGCCVRKSQIRSIGLQCFSMHYAYPENRRPSIRF